jgi:hypothetical protein
MMGMDMMMKALGVDPEALMATVNEAAETAKTGLHEVRMQLSRIEANQLALYQLMVKAGLIQTIEDHNGDVAKLDAPETDHDNRVN